MGSASPSLDGRMRPSPHPLMRSARWRPAYRFLQREHYGNAGKADQRHISKIIDVGPKPRLGIECLVDQAIGLIECRGRGSALRTQILLHTRDCSLHLYAPGRERSGQLIPVQLLMTGDDGIDDGNADASAD